MYYLNDVVKMLNISALAVYEYWVKHPTPHVVVLGRDGWPLVPLLRKMGVPCTYFIFSRLQIGDEGTKQQWLKEVMPGALVVDTGYAGSIFDAIKRFDPSIKGLLLCTSNKKYPQVALDLDHREVVKEIEKLPKIVGRGVSIDKRGYVRCPQDTRDGDETIAGLSPSGVVQLNKQLCVLLDIDVYWASFTGITPSKRIQGDVEEWYAKVAPYRANQNKIQADAEAKAKADADAEAKAKADAEALVKAKEEVGYMALRAKCYGLLGITASVLGVIMPPVGAVGVFACAATGLYFALNSSIEQEKFWKSKA